MPAGFTLFALAPVWILSVIGDAYGDGSIDVFRKIGESLIEYHNAHRIVAALSWTCSLLLGLISLALRRWVFRGDA